MQSRSRTVEQLESWNQTRMGHFSPQGPATGLNSQTLKDKEERMLHNLTFFWRGGYNISLS